MRHGLSGVARLVAYLACPAANFITGSEFALDGGITLTV
jgi:NAD(P)-dependent dehydrogenase (short-subunit alcohol dehydrogenase family)